MPHDISIWLAAKTVDLSFAEVLANCDAYAADPKPPKPMSWFITNSPPPKPTE